MSEKTCPKCGYCDKCGRSNAAPVYPYLPYWWWTQPYGGAYPRTTFDNISTSYDQNTVTWLNTSNSLSA